MSDPAHFFRCAVRTPISSTDKYYADASHLQVTLQFGVYIIIEKPIWREYGK
jgi:hypothetical protein